MKNIYIIALFSFLNFSLVYGQEADSLKKKYNFELSFGQSLLFISNSKQVNLHEQEAVVLPTSSILFFAEFRQSKRLRVPIFFNVATESKQFIVNNQLINEKTSPTFGTGAAFKLIQLKIDDKSKVEMELAPLISFLVDSKDHVRVAPILATRFRVMRGDNFVMYFGLSYSVGINALGLLYGTGTVF